MTEGFVRLAGRGRRDDGALVTWTLAEGSRGRRWRETVVVGGAIVHSLLYETGADGRFTHLELAAPDGLATLHPEGDGTLHGNVVRAGSGVDHVVGVPFAAGDLLLVAGSSIAAAAAARVWTQAGPQESVTLDPLTFTLTHGRALPGSLGQVDERGVPFLDEAETWPLEVAPKG